MINVCVFLVKFVSVRGEDSAIALALNPAARREVADEIEGETEALDAAVELAVEAAQKAGVTMYFTGTRHFFH